MTRYNTSDVTDTVTIAGADAAPPIAWALENRNEDQTVDKLIYDLKSAEGAQKESLLTKLNSAVGEQFDQRQESKAKELKALEEQLASSRKFTRSARSSVSESSRTE